jgi:lysophospholipase L1-like esterase
MNLYNILYLIILVLFIEACGDDSQAKSALILGDSISLGYTPFVQLSGYEFEHAKANDGDDENSLNSAYGLNRLSDWLAQKPHWDLITFNFGIHDMKLVDGQANETLSNYKANLRTIATRLLLATPNVVFIKTVVLPKNAPGYNTDEVALEYAQAAEDVMNELNIPMIDLHTKSAEIIHERIDAELENNVHFTEIGSQHLAEFINEELKKVLGVK